MDLSLIVLTFNREGYLKEFLTALQSQETSSRWELVLVDNGCHVPVSTWVAPYLDALPVPVSLLRRDRNVFSAQRFAEAWDFTSGRFVAMPGDDDIPSTGYVETLSSLGDSPEISVVSGAMRVQDSSGDFLGTVDPPDFESQPEAMASLLNACHYQLPASAVRRDAINWNAAPSTRGSIDWWLWLSGWTQGRASTTLKSVISYREHGGQERHGWDRATTMLESFRMLTSFIADPNFRLMVQSWSRDERDTFVDSLLQGRGPLYGDTQLGSLLQVQLSDVLAHEVTTSQRVDLYSRAAIRLGANPSKSMLRTISDEPDAHIPATMWQSLGVASLDDSCCQVCHDWVTEISLPVRTDAEIVLACSCTTLNADIRPKGKTYGQLVEVVWPAVISDETIAKTIDMIRIHALGSPNDSLGTSALSQSPPNDARRMGSMRRWAAQYAPLRRIYRRSRYSQLGRRLWPAGSER